MKLIKNLNLKKKIFLGLSINFLILFLIIYFVIIPYKDSLLKTKSKIIEGRIALKTLLIKEQKNSKISQKIEAVKPDIKLIDNIFITDGFELDFITTLEELAEKNSLKLNINLGLDKKNTKDFSIPLKLSLSGNYNNIMLFIIELESSKYYINITDLSISNGSGKNSSTRNTSDVTNTNTQLNINALVYWQ